MALVCADCALDAPDEAQPHYYSDFPYDLEAITGDLPYDVSFLATRGPGSPFDAAPAGVRPVSRYADYLIFIRPDHGE